MTFELTQRAKNLSQQTNVEPLLILEIDGIPFKFGTSPITKFWNFDEGFLLDDGLNFDDVVEDQDSRAWIQKEGTTQRLTSQVEIDKGGIGSVQKFNIALTDKNTQVTNIFTSRDYVEDVLSRDCDVYLNFRSGAHPEDSVRIFTGIIDELKYNAGSVNVSCAHPDQLKRQDIFQQRTFKISGAIDDVVTSIVLDDASKLFTPTTDFRTFIQVEDEIIEYTGISTNTLTGCVRGSLNTIAASHDDQSEGNSFYHITGNPINVALRIMLSGRDDAMETETAVSFNQVTPSTYRANSFLIENRRLVEETGLTVGDLATITGSVSNNVSDIAITNFEVIDEGTVVTLGTTLIDEPSATATVTFDSQYNIWPDGLAMKARHIDVAQHQFILEQFGNTFPDYVFYLKDTINGKDFLAEQIYFPVGLYSIVRKGRCSCNMTTPPIGAGETIELNETNVKNPNKLSIERGINKYFYNNITYKYNEDSLEDKFLSGFITLSERSNNRIKAGNRPLTIESKGLRDNATTTNFITRQSRRFTERFQFASETVPCEINFKTGFKIEVGDAVLFGSESLKMTDQTQGNRLFKPRMMEVINKSLGIFTAKINVSLLDTQFGADARYGNFAPSSFLGAGSTTTQLKLKKSFTTGEFDVERDKWTNFIGENITVRTEDYSQSATVRVNSFDTQDETKINIETLPFSPLEDYIVDSAPYDESDKIKTIHTFAGTQVAITAGISGTVFQADVTNLFVGAFIRVHNEDFTVDSTPTLDLDDLEIVDITGNNITVDRDMGFTPTTSEVVSIIGFKEDEGLSYRYI